jgi:multiple antibiotic resistance protein
MPAAASHWFTALAAVFLIVDPLAATPTFLAITAGYSQARRRQMAFRAALTCVLVLSLFGILGKYVFRLFGVSLPAFKFAGGLLLLLIAMDLLKGRPSPTRETPDVQSEPLAHEDVGIIPMGIPMLAGPGSISTVMVLFGQATTWVDTILVLVSIVITSCLCYPILVGADRVGSVLGELGIRVVTRIMGLMLTAIAFQFFIGGLVDLHLISPVPLP